MRPVFAEDSFGAGRLYRFAPKQSRGNALVLLHGVTARGAEDNRLVRLARVLAAEGLKVYVPHLSGLAQFSESLDDLVRIEEAISLARADGNEDVSLLGFSLGGGYALVCSAKKELANLITRVTVIGGHHQLAMVWEAMSSALETLPNRLERATDNELYFALGCAYPRLSEERLGASGMDTLRSVLWNFCDGVDLPSVRRFVRSHLVPHWSVVATCHSTVGSDKLSPAGNLRDVLARVTLLHAPDDALVKLEHAELNYEELKRRPSNAQILLTTRLLEHVVPRSRESLRELPSLARCFANLLP